jgi:hypothetical protein
LLLRNALADWPIPEKTNPATANTATANMLILTIVDVIVTMVYIMHYKKV